MNDQRTQKDNFYVVPLACLPFTSINKETPLPFTFTHTPPESNIHKVRNTKPLSSFTILFILYT